MSADTILTSEKWTERREDRSATIFIIGRVLYRMGVLQLHPQTRLHYRRAVGEYYERTKIINRRKSNGGTDTRMTNKVYLAVASFEKEEDKKNEAIKQIRSCLASYEDIRKEHIIEVRKGMANLEAVITSIKHQRLPQNVIIIGDEPLFGWRNPLATSLKKSGIVPAYLGGTDLVTVFPY